MDIERGGREGKSGEKERERGRAEGRIEARLFEHERHYPDRLHDVEFYWGADVWNVTYNDSTLYIRNAASGIYIYIYTLPRTVYGFTDEPASR